MYKACAKGTHLRHCLWNAAKSHKNGIGILVYVKNEGNMGGNIGEQYIEVSPGNIF